MSNVIIVRSALHKNSTPRKPNWSEVECEYLLKEIRKILPLIRSRKPDGSNGRLTNKFEIWNKICQGLHVKRPAVMRSVCDLKDKWKKLQFMAKKHISRVRSNDKSYRLPDGRIQIPKIVYRVLEARGQDPAKLGYSYLKFHDFTPNNNLTMVNTSLENNPESTSCDEQNSLMLNANVDINSGVKEEHAASVDNGYNDQEERQFSIKIHNAVSLASSYGNQTEHGHHVPTNEQNSHSQGQGGMATSCIPETLQHVSEPIISSQVFTPQLMKRKLSTARRPRDSRALYQRTDRIAKSNRISFNNGSLDNIPSSSHANHDLAGNSVTGVHLNDPVDNQLGNTFMLDDLHVHSSRPLDDNSLQFSPPNHHVTTEAYNHPALEEQPPLVGYGAGRQLCSKGLIGHICDDRVIELQREVLQEERDKIRLEKEILGMHRDKLKLEMIVLQRRIGAHNVNMYNDM